MHERTAHDDEAAEDVATGQPGPGLRVAALWMGASSVLVPLAGLAVQPILARALGTDGRGELAAALAPATLAISVATFGLPEALTYSIARNPGIQRKALAVAVTLSALLGLVCLVVVVIFSGPLAGGDSSLARLISLAMLCAAPLLVIGALRGVAIGRQMYRLAALEALVTTSSRVILFTGLWLGGVLTPGVAVLVTYGAQLAAGLVYFRVLHRPPAMSPIRQSLRRTASVLVGFGWRMWFGSVASMLLARVSQIVVVPLSSTRELGLLSVVITISDVPVIGAMALSAAVYGVNSQSVDWSRVAQAARVVVLGGTLGSGVMAATVPLWLVPVFGTDFADAVPVAVVGLLGAAAVLPGLVLGAGLASAGRPATRSVAYVVALVVNVTSLVLLVPPLGALGAALGGVLTSVMLTSFLLVAACRASGRGPREYLLPGPRDARLLVDVAHGILTRVWRSVRR